MSGNKCQYNQCGKSKYFFPTLKMFSFPNDVECAQKWILNSGMYIDLRIIRFYYLFSGNVKEICTDVTPIHFKS